VGGAETTPQVSEKTSGSRYAETTPQVSHQMRKFCLWHGIAILVHSCTRAEVQKAEDRRQSFEFALVLAEGGG